MDRTVMVCGASRGLGYEMTRRYLELGDMVFAGARDPAHPALRALSEEYPGKLACVAMDVTDTASVAAAAKQVATQTGHLDILVNNAAIHPATSNEPLETADLDECLAVYDVNSMGPLRATKALLPLLRAAKGARVANISSEAGSIGMCQRTREYGYCMSKAALNMGTKMLSNALAPDGIHVMAIQPGWMRTDMGGPDADLDPRETAARLVDLIDRSGPGAPAVFVDNTGAELPW